MLINQDEYQIFKEQHGTKSGVDYRTSKASGVNQDAFKKVEEPIEIKGELVLKIWNNKGRSSILWAYITVSEKEGYYFPLFGMRMEETTSAAMSAELGNSVVASFKKSQKGKCFCSSFSVIQH